jgi:hypothetical protein
MLKELDLTLTRDLYNEKMGANRDTSLNVTGKLFTL